LALRFYADAHQPLFIQEPHMLTSITSHAARQPQTMPAPAALDLRPDSRIAEALALLQGHVPYTRRLLHKGDRVYQVGERFMNLHVVNAGFIKTVNLAADGREQVVGLHFKGDWLGFDGIAKGQYGCDAVAMDTTEVWSLRYDSLLQACTEQPTLMSVLHAAMSREITRDRDSLLSLCTLCADARVADFLRYWAESLARRGMRTDQITLRMTRAEIGNYLGMTLETVSRALSKLAKLHLIDFADKGRRDITIANLQALVGFVQQSVAASRMAMQ
jgi:CRP/FNR family transcriptional regulator, anaerobic regulatory protein